MKRMLSVFLSLVMLVSAVVIPMTVSAAPTEEAKTAAFNAVVEAVNKLDIDLDNVNPMEYGFPKSSNTSSTTAGEEGVYCLVSDVTNYNEKMTLGTKTVKVLKDNVIPNTSGVYLKGHLNSILYELNTRRSNKSESAGFYGYFTSFKHVGYIIVYVKTNRALKLSFAASNSSTQNSNFINGNNAIRVDDTKGNYIPVVLNIQSGLDWVTTYKDYKRTYYADADLTGFNVTVQEMLDGDNQIKDTDDIHFGSMLFVPYDQAVSYFKYNITFANNSGDVQYRFTKLSAEMIAAAEDIKNDDGRYTESSYTDLQNAIEAAKKVLLADEENIDSNVVTLFKNEVDNIYKLEEIYKPTIGGTRSGSTDLSDLNLKPCQEKYFGGYYIAGDGTNNSFVWQKGTSVSASGTDTFNYKDYRDIYVAIKNDGEPYFTDATFYDQHSSRFGLFSHISPLRGLEVQSGYNRFSIYKELYVVKIWSGWGQSTNNFADILKGDSVPNFSNRFAMSAKKHTGTYDDKSNVIYKNLPIATNVYVGSLMGEVAFDTTDLEEVTTKGKAIKYYNEKIAGKGYINTDDIDGTLSALGIFKLPVTGLYKSEDIEFTGDYTFDAVISGEELAFKVNNVPADVTVSVTYGGETVDKDANDEYKFTVTDAEKQLVINLSYITSEFEVNDTSFGQYFSKESNLSFGKDPVVLTTKPDNTSFTRDANHNKNVSNFSNGKLADTPLEGTETSVGVGFVYRKEGSASNVYDGEYYNGYKPYAKTSDNTAIDDSTIFDFDRSQDGDAQFDAYTDIVYDLGYVADISKVQHFGSSQASLTLGAYEVYASERIEDLFKSGSSVIRYQNKTQVTNNGTILSGQQHEFQTKKARFVAFRVYCPVVNTNGTGGYYYNNLRLNELAIYGTKPADVKKPGYTVSTAKLETLWIGDYTLETPAGTVSLLNDGNVTVSGKVDGVDTQYTGDVTGLHDTHYGSGSITIKEFTDFKFRDDKHNLKNGYKISRDHTGNINFTRDQSKEIDTYLDFTYSLDDFYNVSRFDLYSYRDSALGNNKIQAYRVYIGNNKETLYDDKNMVVDFENYLNTSGQRITFDNVQAGKYIGLRVLMPGYETWSNRDFPRICEIAAFGTPVGAPENQDLKPAELSARSVFVYDYDNSSIYKKDGVDCTALRLSVGYSSPAKADGSADAGKIVLKDNTVANVIERNVIVMSKAKYDTLISRGGTFDINTSAARYSTVQGDKLNQYFKAEDLTIDTADNAKFKVFGTYKFHGITQGLKDKEIVVLGRVVYELDGKCYLVYTDVAGTEVGKTISPQSAYDALKSQEGKDQQGWFETVNNQ